MFEELQARVRYNCTHLLTRRAVQVMWILGREFKRVSQNLQWIGYLSSTSVYGDWQGEWVTEECALSSFIHLLLQVFHQGRTRASKNRRSQELRASVAQNLGRRLAMGHSAYWLRRPGGGSMLPLGCPCTSFAWLESMVLEGALSMLQ